MKRTTLRSSAAVARVRRFATVERPYRKPRGLAVFEEASAARYNTGMSRWIVPVAAAAAVVLAAGAAAADTFRGFSGVDRPYLVNQDKVCKPLEVQGGAAAGVPACQKVGADVVARLSIKDPLPQVGAKATFAAASSGRTLTVARKDGGPVVAWDAPDVIVKVVEVYGSQYDDRVAVAYVMRRLGREVTEVVGFDLLKGGGAPGPTPPDPAGTPPTGTPPTGTPTGTPPTGTPPTGTPAPPADPKLAKAVADARKASKAKAAAAWRAVLALDAGHSEALYGVARAQLAAKQPADALATLGTLAASARADAIEWLVEARFDAAFAPLRADPKYRAAVGLDRKAASTYEKLMGFGGTWEQSGTSCDAPEIRFTATRDRAFKLRVKTVCQGSVFDTPFKGTWRIEGARVILTLPNRGKQVTAADETACAFEAAGDEDALRCQIGRDLEFTVLPTRR